MKEKLMRFMYGRYGGDQFSKFLVGMTFVCIVLNIFVGGAFGALLNFLVIALIVYSYFRMFSKNHAKRYRENQIYLKYQNIVLGVFQKEKRMMSYRKTHHIYKCPSCKQKIKIPKGKGRICITCPSCRTEFTKKS